jgi:hypothetical protein
MTEPTATIIGATDANGHTKWTVRAGDDLWKNPKQDEYPWYVVVPVYDSTALDEAIRQANESARVYANQLTVSLHRKLYANETQWQPLPDLYGLLSQIDNMMCGIEPAIKQAKREALLEAKRRLFLATPYESTPAVWYAVVLERMAKELE